MTIRVTARPWLSPWHVESFLLNNDEQTFQLLSGISPHRAAIGHIFLEHGRPYLQATSHAHEIFINEYIAPLPVLRGGMLLTDGLRLRIKPSDPLLPADRLLVEVECEASSTSNSALTSFPGHSLLSNQELDDIFAKCLRRAHHPQPDQCSSPGLAPSEAPSSPLACSAPVAFHYGDLVDALISPPSTASTTSVASSTCSPPTPLPAQGMTPVAPRPSALTGTPYGELVGMLRSRPPVEEHHSTSGPENNSTLLSSRPSSTSVSASVLSDSPPSAPYTTSISTSEPARPAPFPASMSAFVATPTPRVGERHIVATAGQNSIVGTLSTSACASPLQTETSTLHVATPQPEKARDDEIESIWPSDTAAIIRTEARAMEHVDGGDKNFSSIAVPPTTLSTISSVDLPPSPDHSLSASVISAHLAVSRAREAWMSARTALDTGLASANAALDRIRTAWIRARSDLATAPRSTTTPSFPLSLPPFRSTPPASTSPNLSVTFPLSAPASNHFNSAPAFASDSPAVSFTSLHSIQRSMANFASPLSRFVRPAASAYNCPHQHSHAHLSLILAFPVPHAPFSTPFH